MSVFFAPALASLIFKVFVLSLVVRGGKVSIMFLSLICVFAFHNAIELIGYVQFLNDSSVELYFRPYYVATIYVSMYVLLHGLAISRFENTVLTSVLVLIATALSLLVIFTDTIVAGHYSIGYSVSAIEGPFYWVFSLYILITLIASTSALLYRYRSAVSQLESVRCLYSLFALSPLILVSLVVLALKAAEVNINGAVLIPIATAVFLAIVLKGESQHKLSDIRRFLPFSPERAISNNLMELIDGYTHGGNQTDAYKNLHASIEREIIFYTLNKCDNNITRTTQMMGLKNRSTLYSMMNRLEIDHQSLKGASKG